MPTLLVALPHPKVVVLLLAAGSKWIDWWAGGAVRCALPGQRFCRPRARALVQQLIREGKLSGDAHAETIAHAKTWRVRRPPLELLDDK